MGMIMDWVSEGLDAAHWRKELRRYEGQVHRPTLVGSLFPLDVPRGAPSYVQDAMQSHLYAIGEVDMERLLLDAGPIPDRGVVIRNSYSADEPMIHRTNTAVIRSVLSEMGVERHSVGVEFPAEVKTDVSGTDWEHVYGIKEFECADMSSTTTTRVVLFYI